MQIALKESSGTFAALLTLRRNAGVSTSAAVAACGQLLRHFEDENRSPDNLFVLLGFGGELLIDIVGNPGGAGSGAGYWPSAGDLEATVVARAALCSGDAPDLCIQISAPTELDRIHALRCVDDRLGALFASAEILGGQVRAGEDALGFRSNRTRYAPEDLPAFQTTNGGSWLFCAHFNLDVKGFFTDNATEAQRAVAMGRAPALVTPALVEGAFDHASRNLAHDPAFQRRRGMDAAASTGGGHAVHMQPHKGALLRRGFTCRAGGKEGLAFVAASATIPSIKAAVDRFAAGDLIQPFTNAMFRACFYCPANETFVNPDAWAPSGMCREAQNPVELVAYDVPKAELDYIRQAIQNGQFMNAGATVGGQQPAALYEQIFLLLDTAISQTSGGRTADLTALRADMMKSANVLNGWLEYYFTKG